MDENQQQTPSEDITAPDGPTHEATSPPSNPDSDSERREQAEEELDKAGGGH